MQAVVLAGGKGTRLASRLNGRPKPLIEVDGVPLLERQLQALARHGVDDVVVLVNHAADQIEAFFHERSAGPNAVLIDDGEPRGTAGAVLACWRNLADRFLVIYGDTLFDIDVEAMLAAHEASGAAVTILLHPNDHPADSDLVEIDAEGRVLAFHGYPHAEGVEHRNLVNAAFYICEKAALEPWISAAAPIDFAKNLFPMMLDAGVHIHGYVSFEYIKDLGTPGRLDKVERHLRAGVPARARREAPQRVVFLDRDGTLNELRDYVRKPEDLVLLAGAAASVRRLNEAEYRVFLVTNQPVLARGECDDATMERIHARLDALLGEEGGWLDGVHLCPHHPDSGFAGEVVALKGPCECRKPNIGLYNQVASSVTIDLENSWMVGDSTADILAGNRFGLRTILVGTGEGGRDRKWPEAVATFSARSISEAVDLILDCDPVQGSKP